MDEQLSWRQAEVLGERLTLVPLTPDLADTILAGNFSRLTERGMVPAPGWPRGDTLEIVSLMLVDQELAGPGWLIIRREDHAIIGDLGCKGKPNACGEVEIGYGVVPRARGRGYGKEAVQLLVGWLYRQPEIKHITAQCFSDNLPSVRILEGLGMRRVGLDGAMLTWCLSKGES